MTPPCYKNGQPDTQLNSCNRGLLFERFYDEFDENRNWETGDQKAVWLRKHFIHKRAGSREQLQKHALQHLQLINNLNGKAEVFSTEYHFVTGMGNPHPVENGLSWHRTLGVPYLTGAAVKGIVRSWLEVWEPEENDASQKERLLDLFGSTSKNPREEDYATGTGKLIFFDAFPLEPPEMVVDIMTPHMGKWYEQGGEIKNIQKDHTKIPADWHNPNPIPYLCIKKARFFFAVAPRNSQATMAEVDSALEMLKNALNFMGAGAKTAVGYGQMRPDKGGLDKLYDVLKKQQEHAENAAMTDEEQQLGKFRKMFANDREIGNKTPGGATNQYLLSLVKKADGWKQEDKIELAKLGSEFYDFAGWGANKKKKSRKAMFTGLLGE